MTPRCGMSCSRLDDSGAKASTGGVAPPNRCACSSEWNQSGSWCRGAVTCWALRPPRGLDFCLSCPPPTMGRMGVGVTARHLAGPRTGIEVYMEHLLAALSHSGKVRITALSWAPLDLHLEGVTEVIPARR